MSPARISPPAASSTAVPASCRAYRTGRGSVYVRAKAEVEVDEKTSRETIIVHEIPYQVNKARLIEKIAEAGQREEKKSRASAPCAMSPTRTACASSSRSSAERVRDLCVNNLYKHTQMQTTFGINMVALDNNQPSVMNLKEINASPALYRREVVTRRTVFELRKARDRAHILEGLAVALANIDPIIELIRHSATPADAKAALVAKGWELGNVAAMLEKAGDDAARPEWLEPEFGIREGQYFLTEIQAQAILDLRLHKLTGLEHVEDPGRVPISAGSHRRAAAHPGKPGTPDGSDP
ncbi:DNA gyrase subunit A [Escherichia coli]